MSAEDKQPCLNWDDHDFEEVYYGHRCRKCDLFYAHGCAPWDMPEVDGGGPFDKAVDRVIARVDKHLGKV